MKDLIVFLNTEHTDVCRDCADRLQTQLVARLKQLLILFGLFSGFWDISCNHVTASYALSKITFQHDSKVCNFSNGDIIKYPNI